MYAQWVAGKLNDDGTPKSAPASEHRTRTVLDAHQSERYVTKANGSCGRYVRSETSTALCTCGWNWDAADRTEARAMARAHRAEAGQAPADMARSGSRED